MKTKLVKNKRDGVWRLEISAESLSDIIHLDEIFENAPRPKAYHKSSGGFVGVDIYFAGEDYGKDMPEPVLSDEKAEILKNYLNQTRGLYE